MKKLKRGDKIFLDKEETQESEVNHFLDCRDGIVEVYEYRNCSGYGEKTRLFLCENVKHETISIIRQSYYNFTDTWIEESMAFDSDSFEFLKALIHGDKEQLGGIYSVVRDFR